MTGSWVNGSCAPISETRICPLKKKVQSQDLIFLSFRVSPYAHCLQWCRNQPLNHCSSMAVNGVTPVKRPGDSGTTSEWDSSSFWCWFAFCAMPHYYTVLWCCLLRQQHCAEAQKWRTIKARSQQSVPVCSTRCILLSSLFVKKQDIKPQNIYDSLHGQVQSQRAIAKQVLGGWDRSLSTPNQCIV